MQMKYREVKKSNNQQPVMINPARIPVFLNCQKKKGTMQNNGISFTNWHLDATVTRYFEFRAWEQYQYLPSEFLFSSHQLEDDSDF